MDVELYYYNLIRQNFTEVDFYIIRELTTQILKKFIYKK